MEWFYYKKNVKTYVTMFLFFVPIVTAFYVLINQKDVATMITAPEVNADQTQLCIEMNSDTLANLLKRGEASKFIDISKPKSIFGGNFSITCKESTEAKEKFAEIFICGSDTNSFAAQMAKDYEHIFTFNEEKLKISLASHHRGKYTTVPAWWIVNLVDAEWIEIPQ